MNKITLTEEELSHRRTIVNNAIEKGCFVLMDNYCVVPISLEDDTLLYVEDGQQSICHISNHVFGEC